MSEIIMYIQTNWTAWLFTVTGTMLGYIVHKLQVQQKESKAVSDGVQSLLRENIVENYNKYQDRGYCPIYAKESIKHIYNAYHNLNGDDVATKLYKTLLDMPEELRRDKGGNE